MSSGSLVIRRLYRSLLKAAAPFSSPSADATVLSCLLHRTGIDDRLESPPEPPVVVETPTQQQQHQQEKQPPEHPSYEEARDLRFSYADYSKHEETTETKTTLAQEPPIVIFRRLLRQVVHGQMQFPCQAEPHLLKTVLAREFRTTTAVQPNGLEVAFLALRALNTKLAWAHQLQTKQTALKPHPQQAARHVSVLPYLEPSSYLKPGCFLVAHPLLTGYFARTVICILDHTTSGDSTRGGGTYGLIVNRGHLSPTTGRNRTLLQVVREDCLAPEVAKAFGQVPVKEGGPVDAAVQMLYSCGSLDLGGTVLNMIPDEETESPAFYSDRAVAFRGDVLKAAKAVNNGEMDADDMSFFVGASCWGVGQLENEIANGFWLPCRGPPEMALSGMCDHEPSTDGERPRADLWLSMMSAIGEEEGKLAHLLWQDSEEHEYGDACDSF